MNDADKIIIANLLLAINADREAHKPTRIKLGRLEEAQAVSAAARFVSQARLNLAIEAAQAALTA